MKWSSPSNSTDTTTPALFLSKVSFIPYLFGPGTGLSTQETLLLPLAKIHELTTNKSILQMRKWSQNSHAASQDGQPVVDESGGPVQGYWVPKPDLPLHYTMIPESFFDAANLLLVPKIFISPVATGWQLKLPSWIKAVELCKRWMCHIKQKPLWRQRGNVAQNTSKQIVRV